MSREEEDISHKDTKRARPACASARRRRRLYRMRFARFFAAPIACAVFFVSLCEKIQAMPSPRRASPGAIQAETMSCAI